MAPKFQYKRRGADNVKKRMNQSGNTREGFLEDSVEMYKVKDGDNLLRILPPTFTTLKGGEPEHYGMDVFVHYDVGSDKSAFLCLEQNYGEPCPICQARMQAEADGDKDFAESLKPRKRTLIYVIDRDNEDTGPMVWSAPWTVDKDLSMRSFDKRTGEVYYPDDPEEGYDIEFSREGKGRNTKYAGVQLARRPSPLHDDEDLMDEWLEKIADKPLDSLLLKPDATHMTRVFNAGIGLMGSSDEDKPARSRRGDDDDRPARSRRGDDDDKPARSRRGDDDDKPSRSRRDEDDRPARSRRDEDDKPSRSRREEPKDEEDRPSRSRREEPKDEEDRPSRSRREEPKADEPVAGNDDSPELEYDDVMGMDRDDLEALIEEGNLDIPDAADMEDEELAAEICAEMGLKKTRRRNSAVRERLNDLREAG